MGNGSTLTGDLHALGLELWNSQRFHAARLAGIQLQVDESMRGRIIALHLMAINVAIGVGTMVQGALYDWIGARMAVAIGAATIVVLAAWLVGTRRFDSMDVGTAAS